MGKVLNQAPGTCPEAVAWPAMLQEADEDSWALGAGYPHLAISSKAW